MIRRALDLQHRLTGEPLFETIKRYLIFVVGGFTGWLILIGFHTLFRNVFGTNPVVSYAIGITFATFFTFFYHRFITFKINTRMKTRFIQFSVVVLFISFSNWGMFAIGRQVLNLQIADFIMSFLITLVLSVINFAINRVVVFRHH